VRVVHGLQFEVILADRLASGLLGYESLRIPGDTALSFPFPLCQYDHDDDDEHDCDRGSDDVVNVGDDGLTLLRTDVHDHVVVLERVGGVPRTKQ